MFRPTPPELKKIATLLKLATGVSQDEITGFAKDTTFKLWGCYLATKLTGCTKREIAKYFKINPEYMESRMQDYAVGFLVNTDPEATRSLEELMEAYRELEAADAKA